MVRNAAQNHDGPDQPVKLDVRNLTIRYGHHVALQDVSLDVRENEIFGIIGPANAGKTSFIKAINRMDMFTPSMRVDGQVLIDGGAQIGGVARIELAGDGWFADRVHVRNHKVKCLSMRLSLNQFNRRFPCRIGSGVKFRDRVEKFMTS